MPEKLIKKIRTSEGDLQIDYNALANLPDINKALEEILEDLPISWNDLTDKPFGEELIYSCESRAKFKDGHEASEALVEGNIYTVVFDGVPYTCVAREYEGYIMLGNNSIYPYDGDDTTDTGEPFAIEQEAGKKLTWGYLAENDSSDHTVQILVVKTIDPKYLPHEPASIDFSALDTEGKIVETFADGSTRTTTMEFDADGNPIKITDADGNVTILTWGG